MVIANAYDAQHFQQSQWLPTKTIRGQITYIAQDPVLESLGTNLCAKGYISPLTFPSQFTSTCTLSKQSESEVAFHSVGASFNLNDFNTELSDQDHKTNLNHLQTMLPQLKKTHILGGRVGFRCTSTDYLPLVGPLPDISAFEDDFAEFSHNAKQLINKPGCYYPNLYINVAHGSKGLCYTPLAAALIAHTIAGVPPPCAQSVADSLNPARFIIRRIMRTRAL